MTNSTVVSLTSAEQEIVETSISAFCIDGLAGLMNHVIDLQLNERAFRMEDVCQRVVVAAILERVRVEIETFTLDPAEQLLLSAFLQASR